MRLVAAGLVTLVPQPVPKVAPPIERFGEASVLDEIEWQDQPRHVQAIAERLLRAGAFVLDGRPVTAKSSHAWEEELQAAIEEGDSDGYGRGEDDGYGRGEDDGYQRGYDAGYAAALEAGLLKSSA